MPFGYKHHDCHPSHLVSHETNSPCFCSNVDLILINPRVLAKSKCQNVITNPPVIAKSNQPKPKDLEASKSNVYCWLLLLWAMTTGAELMDLDTLNYGGLGPHPRGGGGAGGGFLL